MTPKQTAKGTQRNEILLSGQVKSPNLNQIASVSVKNVSLSKNLDITASTHSPLGTIYKADKTTDRLFYLIFRETTYIFLKIIMHPNRDNCLFLH